LSKCSTGLAKRAARLLYRISERRSNGAVDAQKYADHGFSGRYRMHHCFHSLINRYTPNLSMIVALQKPRLVISHDITEADSQLSENGVDSSACVPRGKASCHRRMETHRKGGAL
jgi:hypothetical protein